MNTKSAADSSGDKALATGITLEDGMELQRHELGVHGSWRQSL